METMAEYRVQVQETCCGSGSRSSQPKEAQTRCLHPLPKRSDLFQEKLVIWVRKHCSDQRQKEKSTVCRHHCSHLAGRSPRFSASCACLLTALLVISCSSPSTGLTRAASPGGAGSPRITPVAPTRISQATSTVITRLAPMTTPLAPPPQDCVIKPPPQQKHLESLGLNSNVQLVGGGAFWIDESFYPSVLHLGQLGADQRWPMTKWVVEVGPNSSLPVTLRLRDTGTKTPAWWTDGQTPPRAATQTLILNPLTDTEDVGSVPGVPDVAHGPSGPGWSEWGLFPVFSAAGCYSLEVSWTGGSWQSIMAVGR